jgi:predicted GNAT family acetyltransferase
MTTEVTDAPDRSRYELAVDGELVGFAEYRMVEGVRVFTHTEVFDELQRKGLGTALAQGALDDVRARGLKLVPQCPFIAAFVRDHDEYAGLVDPDLTERITARRR